MRWIPLLLLLGAFLVPTRPSAGGDPEPGPLFTRNCAPCHTVPDPALRADRAWLERIHRTT